MLNQERINEKLSILADAAKYDVSCSSSGSKRKNPDRGLGDTTGMGICHTYTEDGRCVSLLKILLTNHCIFDCAYCVSRRSNDIKRAAFTVDEVVELTVNFYRRNFIEGLFLSSGIFKDPDTTMERLVRVAKKLRIEQKFYGYIHLKSIPGASDDLMAEAGKYADRLSVNIELPTASGLKLLAPDKSEVEIYKPMSYITKQIADRQAERKPVHRSQMFAPAGQSSQMVIGATPETDLEIIQKADYLYKDFKLRRVYYSGYVPISEDSRLPAITSAPPMLRENRLYQADWLMRVYGFDAKEIITPDEPNFDQEIDPKASWALRNMHLFPIDINAAPYEMIVRVPGIGIKTAQKIVAGRRGGKITLDILLKMGIAYNRARYFITCGFDGFEKKYDFTSSRLRDIIIAGGHSKYNIKQKQAQLSLF